MHGKWLHSDTEQQYYNGSELNERGGQEIKENNDIVWSVTPEERCGQTVRKDERGTGLISVKHCVREEESTPFFINNPFLTLATKIV